MERQYAEQFLATGSIRVGSLYSFRKVQKYGEEIGDEGEGTKTLYTDQRELTAGTVPQFLQERVRLSPGQQIIARDDYRAGFEDLNLYVFCVSREFDEHTASRLGYDACIVIESAFFFQHLQVAMRPHVKPTSYGVFGNVHYGTRERYHERDPNIAMALIKPEKLDYQREARAIWIPRPDREVSEYVDVQAPMAISACRQKLILL